MNVCVYGLLYSFSLFFFFFFLPSLQTLYKSHNHRECVQCWRSFFSTFDSLNGHYSEIRKRENVCDETWWNERERERIKVQGQVCVLAASLSLSLSDVCLTGSPNGRRERERDGAVHAYLLLFFSFVFVFVFFPFNSVYKQVKADYIEEDDVARALFYTKELLASGREPHRLFSVSRTSEREREREREKRPSLMIWSTTSFRPLLFLLLRLSFVFCFLPNERCCSTYIPFAGSMECLWRSDKPRMMDSFLLLRLLPFDC